MPLVGLCGEPKEALEKIEYMMQALSLQGQFSEEEPVRAEKSGQTEFIRITEKSAEALEALDCLIWSGSCENALSEEVDSLLEEYPRLAVIFVADSPDAVFDALTKPFFHVVRGYALEQDLKAALAKLKNRGARAAVTGAFRIGKALRPTAESGCGKRKSCIWKVCGTRSGCTAKRRCS